MIAPLPFVPDLSVRPEVAAFFDGASNTLSYVVSDPRSDACAVIDPVLNFDVYTGRVSTEGADEIIAHIRQRDLRLEWLVETHVHADHISAAQHIQRELGGNLGIGHRIVQVQEIFAEVFHAESTFERDGSQFDRLFDDGDSYSIGTMTAFAMDTPGHTPACMTHVIGDAAFVGDTLFMPDSGTARADFRGGSARMLYRSIRRILQLPPEMRLFVCHDYGWGRPIAWQTTVGEERASNIHMREGVDEDAFVAIREARDATLDQPRQIIPSLQINMRAGRLPPPESDGRVYLKVPLGEF